MHHLGFTRSVSRREYLLHTPDAFVRTPLPGLTNGSAILHVAPQIGAGFSMTAIDLAPGGVLAAGPAQRFVYVLSGAARLSLSQDNEIHELSAGSFCYVPSGTAHIIAAEDSSRFLLFEKLYAPLTHNKERQADPPRVLVGHEENVAATALNGDDALQVRCLLPSSPAFDLAVNTMTYAPGASLSQVEVHYMEHGLLMLEGDGIYRLGDDWHPVTAGDAIWMGPFCPQWFAAIGKVPAKYILYKDINRHVLG